WHRSSQSADHVGRVFRRSEATVRERDARARPGEAPDALRNAHRDQSEMYRRPPCRRGGNRVRLFTSGSDRSFAALPKMLLPLGHFKNSGAVLQKKPVTNWLSCLSGSVLSCSVHSPICIRDARSQLIAAKGHADARAYDQADFDPAYARGV